jgi:3-dehydroquinate synthase
MRAGPGAFRPARDRWGPFPDLFRTHTRSHTAPILTVADRRVLELHPAIARSLGSRAALIRLTGGEQAKTFAVLERILRAGTSLPREGLVLAIGGGSIGDVATVAAHLLKRGLTLIHVPTTLLAAVDSSVGGKGAVHVAASGQIIKNAAGVFHYPLEGWICQEIFASLSPRQLFEGEVEAYKMAAALDSAAWRRYRRRKPGLASLVREARALKNATCAADPYEGGDQRRLLNLGHTFGHVLESLTGFELSHGEAVCLGIVCALDVGRELGVAPESAAGEVEQVFTQLYEAVHSTTPRAALAQALSGVPQRVLASLLAADKKVDAHGQLRMALLTGLGRSGVFAVEGRVWRALWGRRWRRGR